MVDLDKNIDMNDVTPNCRVALRNDSYTLHKILPNKVRREDFFVIKLKSIAIYLDIICNNL